MTNALSVSLSFSLRITALTIIFAMLVPAIFIDDLWGDLGPVKIKAATSVPAPVSAPPEHFLVQSSKFKVQSLLAFGKAALTERLASGVATGIKNAFVRPVLSVHSLLSYALADTRASASEPQSVSHSSPLLTPPPPAGSVRFDFDGDLKADIGRWHATTTEFKVKNSGNGTFTTTIPIGTTTGKSCPADFDADGKTDPAVFSAGTWKIKKSSNSQIQTITGFGLAGDIPLPGNYRGSTATDAAVFRPSNNTWYFRDGATGAVTSQVWGAAGDIPVPGNYNGDALTDVAVYRPATGVWHIVLNGGGNLTYTWGISTDIPVPADYDGDNKTDVAVYRRTTGTWYVIRSLDGAIVTQGWGNYGDQPTPADYDGDNKADFSIWRPTTGKFHTLKSSNLSFDVQTLGVAGDTAVPSSYIKQIGGTVSAYQLAQDRLSPKNATGGTDLYSRNFAWGTSLAGLPGRAGMNAGFGIGYNSLVWTKSGSEIYFDTDAGNVSPGFRIGFPTIEPAYYDSLKGAFAYLMVTPSGGRVEFRQVAATGIYETVDSSYAQLKTAGAANPNDPVENITITVTSTDGTQMKYLWKSGAFRCTEIKDRNGNYITLVYDDYGLLQTMTDTLGRVVTVVYDTSLYPVTVKQSWQSGDHNYATFAYTNVTVNTNFTSPITSVIGPPNGTVIKALEKITYADLSYTKFTYNSYGQVWKVQNFAADNHELNYVRTNLESISGVQTDCPRLGQSISWVENFNGGTETTVTNTLTAGQPYSVGGLTGTGARIDVTMSNHPDGLYSRTFVGETGWKEGLPIATEDCIGANCADRKRWTWTDYIQDNIALSYILNPRVKEARVGDSANVKRTAVEYLPLTTGSPIALYGLVKKVEVFDTGLSTVIKKVETDYLLTKGYTDRNIIGLPSETRAWGKNDLTQNLEQVSRVTYGYDEGTFSQEPNQIIAPTRHDTANYGSAFTKRGNLTSTTRHDVTGQTSAVTSQVRYDIAGSPVAQIDPLGRKVRIGYTDDFQPSQSFTTFAYPTTITDPAGSSLGDTLHSSTVKYRYDIGANVEAISPAPAGNTLGKKTTRLFDTYGRLEKETIVNSGAYTRYEYPTNGIQSKVFSTIIDTNGNGADALDEVMSESWSDGAGRVRRSRTEHPGSIGGWSATIAEYDILGRVKRSSVPTEVSVPNANDPDTWTPAGDDTAFLWTYQKYDWKGRVTRKINTDGIDSPTLNDSDVLISYDGCGCAGGQVTTIEGENIVETDWQGNNPVTLGRRKQKIYQDILGRDFKTEVMNWNGTSIYGTTVNTYNGRDQITNTHQYAGDTNSSTWRATTMTYDGVGRMKTRQYPIENPGTNTSWTYNTDDSINTTTDPRGVVTNFSYYPTTGLLHQIMYDVPGGLASTVPDTPDVTYTYDNLGNRTAMTDGTGSNSYAYNELSQMTAETKNFIGLTGSFTINYAYNLSGGLKTTSDPQDSARKVIYNHDRTGRVIGADMEVQSVTTQYVRNTKYRAWGDLKEYKYDIVSQYPTQETYFKFTYDNRLRIGSFETGLGTSLSSTFSFQRYADGNVKALVSAGSSQQDRLYKYDHVGRMTVGLTGKEANGDPNILDGPFKQNISYNAFSEADSITGKNWGIPLTAYSKFYAGATGRDSLTGYDAAGNVVTDRIRTYPTPILNRTMKYDAAGRQVETFDPAVHTCCEVNRTIYNYYDGNGWLAKNENTASGQTATAYNIRSTVLGGEVAGTMNTSSGSSIVNKTFTAPVIGGKLSYSADGPYGVTYTRVSPEGMFEYGAYLPDKSFDPRGADAGFDQPVGEGGGYSGGGGDPTTFTRCAEGGVPQSCDMQSRFNDAWNRIEGLIAKDSAKGTSSPKTGAGSSIVHESRHSDPTSEKTTETDKPESAPDKGSAVDPASVPCTDGVGQDGVITICTREARKPRIGGGVNASAGMDTDDNRTLVARAIQDVKDIFGTDNECSNFFGLARPYDSMFEIVGRSRRDATGVANTLGNQLLGENGIGFLSASKANNTSIGIEMSPGKNSYTSSTSDGLTYRVFGKAVVNSRGPFFNSVSIGGYTSTSRAGRALLLLHEIAHMIITGVTTDKKGKATGSTYLIVPNDGDGDETQDESVANSKIVAAKCKKQLDALK